MVEQSENSEHHGVKEARLNEQQLVLLDTLEMAMPLAVGRQELEMMTKHGSMSIIAAQVEGLSATDEVQDLGLRSLFM